MTLPLQTEFVGKIVGVDHLKVAAQTADFEKKLVTGTVKMVELGTTGAMEVVVLGGQAVKVVVPAWAEHY